MSKEAMKLALRVALENLDSMEPLGPTTEAVIDAAQKWYLAEQPAQQDPVAVVDLRNANYVRWLEGVAYPVEGSPLYTTPQAQPAQQEPVAMREFLAKIARFLGVVRVYAQDIKPKHELETDKPLHWKARELQDEVIRLLDTTPQAQPAREWVGLTDEDKEFIAKRASVYDWHDYEVIEASEAKLKEKNT